LGVEEPPLAAGPQERAPTGRTPAWPPPDDWVVTPPRLGVGRIVLGILTVAAIVGALIFFRDRSLRGRFGQRLAVTDKEEIYYKDVTAEEALRLGQALKELGYFNGTTRKTVQLSQQDDAYVIAFVVQEGTWNNAEAVDAVRLLGLQLAARTFDGRPVEVRLCDQSMREKKSLDLGNESLGKRLAVSPQEEIYYRDVKEEQARRLGELLQQIKYFDGQGPRTVLVARDAAGVKLTFVVMEGFWNDAEMLREIQALGQQIRREIFGNEAAEIRLSDERLRVKKTLPLR
jgi:hypothetical protein